MKQALVAKRALWAIILIIINVHNATLPVKNVISRHAFNAKLDFNRLIASYVVVFVFQINLWCQIVVKHVTFYAKNVSIMETNAHHVIKAIIYLTIHVFNNVQLTFILQM